MRTNSTNSQVALGVAATLLTSSLILAAVGAAQSQESGQSQATGQSQEGPTKSAGEGVLAPKKAPNATAPAEKKPEKINPAEIPTIKTTTSLVNVDVLVVDKDGNPIPRLGKKNFKVYDDGVEQAVTNFGTGEAPMTAVLLLEFANQFWVNVYNALRYSYTFLDYIQPNDWIAVIDFDLKPHILLDFTHDRSQVEGALDQERIPGFSEICLYDAVAYTIDRMKDIQGRKAIIAVCTGIDTFSKLTYGQLLKIVKTSDTPIYPVSTLEWLDVRMGGSFNAEVAKSQLQYIAQYSGGQAYFPRFAAEVPSIYQQIAGQLRTEYSLGFVPSNSARDGKFHKLKVDLVDEQGNPLRITNQKGKQVKYKLVSRDGYYAPKS
jgi:VWFA-related protein